MGPKNTKPISTQDEEKQLIDHPRFHEAEFIKQELEVQICIKIPVGNQKQIKYWQQRIQKGSDILMIPIKHHYQNIGMCGSSGIVSIFYPNYPYLLSNEINNRQGLNRKIFDQNQLWYILYTLLVAGNQYHSKNQKVGDIRPSNIFINENGQVKVSTKDSWPGEQTNYYKTFYQKQITYLSPEQIRTIKFARMENPNKESIAEAFSIGLTCLDAATLTDSTVLYLDNLKFDYKGLQNKLNALNIEGYSDALILAITSLCEVDSDRRSTCNELMLWLKPHQEAINNLEDFNVLQIPQKLKKIEEQRGKSQLTSQSRKPKDQQQKQLNFLNNNPFNAIQSSYPINGQNKQQYWGPKQPHQVYKSPPMVSTSSYAPTYVTQTKVAHSSQTFNTYQQPTYKLSSNVQQASQYSPPQVSSNYPTDRSTLNKIDEQLQLSRKMFPS